MQNDWGLHESYSCLNSQFVTPHVYKGETYTFVLKLIILSILFSHLEFKCMVQHMKKGYLN